MPPMPATVPFPAASASKAEWRAAMRQSRKALAGDPTLHQSLSDRLQQNLMGSRLWRQSPRVALYYAVRGEADTRLLLQDALQSGKEVFLPRCRPEEPGLMDMCVCRGLDDLALSAQGIPEPPPSAPVLRQGEPEDGMPGPLPSDLLLVVPGLAFDKEGYRLGYGGGYYDRLLAPGVSGGSSLASVGLVFCAHLVTRLPRDPWDMPVTALCTEESLLCL